MSTWAVRAKLHLSQKGHKVSAISDETPLLSLMAPPFGALCEKRDSANDPTIQVPAPPDDTTPAVTNEPDRHCWPHTTAMNGSEIDTFMARLVRFTTKGVIHDDAEQLADKLVARDRESDDRRLCLECNHLSGHAGLWRCRDWPRAGIVTQARDAGLPGDLVRTLQRCDGFSA